MPAFKFKAYTPDQSAHGEHSSSIPLPQILPHEDPYQQGSFAYDQLNGYTYHWKSIEDATTWRFQQEKDHTIEFVRREKRLASSGVEHLWSEKHFYVCSRGASGGNSEYTKKHDHVRKIPNKRTECPSCLTLKLYPHTGEVLGRYDASHNHEIGNSNVRFTRLHKDTRDEIERLLRLGVEPRRVLEQFQGKIYSEKNASNLRNEGAHRHEFCTRADVRRIEKTIEEESIRLAGQDGASVMQWVTALEAEGHSVYLKTAKDKTPSGSDLTDDAFILIIQTKYQKECWQTHGSRFAGIDATHNTTHYEGMNLFTLLVRDRWGHGVPAAWMISSNGTGDTISHFLRFIRTGSPTVIPEYFMSDKDRAEINAMELVYPESKILLCWWHVLHAWQQHFVTSHYPELWDLLKKWIRIQDSAEFDAAWEKIKSMAPNHPS